MVEVSRCPGEANKLSPRPDKSEFGENPSGEVDAVVVLPVRGHHKIIGGHDAGVEIDSSESEIVDSVAKLFLDFVAAEFDFRQAVTVHPLFEREKAAMKGTTHFFGISVGAGAGDINGLAADPSKMSFQLNEGIRDTINMGVDDGDNHLPWGRFLNSSHRNA